MSDGESRQVLTRYTSGERTTHWLVALAFLLTALSGLALFHPALFWFSAFFGGGPWTRILHPFLGLFMMVVFLALAGSVWDDNRMRPADWQWLRRWKDVVNNREERLPEVGRYNAGQKVLFFVIVACLLGLLLSGFIIWRQYFSSYFGIGLIRFASVLHSICAFVLICAILLHIYAAIWVKGSIHAMLRGTVTAGWAWKHHRAWFRQITHAAHPRTRSD
ncbi:MAG TPA: formate dehydrogenase subunit gamma [Steroidobacteraceae bacterium]|jgi:formate dehydrogenase subunit gamma|nr:formate dehydrogenase subunit gamma [Steroidobacteraceae bacterium]